MSDKNKPEDILRDGSLKASIWRNEGEKGPYYTTVLAKTCEDREGNLRDTYSFSGTDLLRVSELSRQAYTRSNELYREYTRSYDREEQTSSREQFKEARQTKAHQDRGHDQDR